MKSPEDQIDDGLRDALKRRFDDFEMEPEQSLKQNIFAALKVWQQDKNSQRNWIVLLTLAILLTGTLFYRSTRHSVAKPLSTKVKVNANQPLIAVKPAPLTVAVPAKYVAKNISAPASPIEPIGNSSIAKQSERAGPGKENGLVEFSKNKTTDFEQTNSKIPDLPVLEDIDSDENAEKGIVNEKSGVVIDNDFALLDNLPTHFNRPQMPVPEPEAPDSNYFVKSKTSNHGWTILAGVTPVKTFQVVNVISNPGFIYQNFQFPRSASLETLGYKLNAGIAKNGFEFLVSYSHYRQSVRYEQAGDEFEIIPGAANDAQVIRKFTTVNSDRILRLAGIGVRKQFIPRSPAFRDFYAVIGTEFSRELTQGKNMAWLNAGIGRQVALSKNTTLQIGPYLEYGFTKLRSSEGSLQVKPYQVGLSIILKNRLMK